MGVRLFAASFVLVMHALVAWLLLNPDAPGGSSASSERVLAGPPIDSARRRPAPSRFESYPGSTHVPVDGDSAAAARTVSPAWDDPVLLAAYEAGRALDERRMATLDQAMEVELPADYAALLQGPPQEAWWRFESLAMKGDRLAGDLLAYLAAQCPENPKSRTEGTLRWISRLQQSLAPEDAAFVTGALQHEVLVVDTFDAQCRAHGLGWGRIAAMLGLPDPTANEEWQEWGYRQALLEQYRQAFGGGLVEPELTPAEQALDRLRERESTAASDDLATAMAAADFDPGILRGLAHCFERGCEQIPALPLEQLRPWQERAARTGSLFAAESLTRADESSGALESAWAWAWYERWLAANACGMEPRMLNYVTAAEALQRIAGQLDSTARARAARLGADRIAQFGPTALAATGCTG